MPLECDYCKLLFNSILLCGLHLCIQYLCTVFFFLYCAFYSFWSFSFSQVPRFSGKNLLLEEMQPWWECFYNILILIHKMCS